MRRKIVSLVLIIIFIFTILVYAEIRYEDKNYFQKQIEKIVVLLTTEGEQITTPNPIIFK